MRLKIKYSLILAFLFISQVLLAQSYKTEERWRWTHFTIEDGLPSNAVFNVIETRDSTPWVNTREGLAWFNGYYWVGIDSNKGLPKQQMSLLLPDFNDSVLVMDRARRLYYGGKHGFRSFQISVDGAEVPVSAVARYGDGRFIFLSNSSLLIGDTKTFEKYTLPEEFAGQKIFNIWNPEAGSLWMNASAGLYRREKNRWILRLPTEKIARSMMLLTENSYGHGMAYVAIPPHDVGLWEWSSGTQPRKIESEGIDAILSLDIDNNNNNRIILKETDLIKIKRENSGYETIQLIPEIKNILSVKFRINGDLWVSTVNGLYLFSSSSRLWSVLKYPSTDDRNKINDLISTRDGSIWAATGGGIVIYRKNGTVTGIQTIGDQAIRPVTGLVEDDEGNIWISSGHAFDGAYRWDGRQWRHYGLRDGLDAGSIHKIRKDSNGRLWFLGLYRKDFDDRNVEQEPGPYIFEKGVFSPWGYNQGLPSARYYAFEEGADGSFWFGTSDGMIRWTPDPQGREKGSITRWTTKNGALSNSRVFTLALDRNRTLWFGDRWSGLGYVKNDTVRYLTTSEGLVSNDVWSITIDASGRLWIGTYGGMSIYDNGVFSSFKYDEGLENTKIWPILPLADKVYIGTLGGGIHILTLEELNPAYPKVVIYPPMIEKQNAYLRWRAFSFWGTQPSDNIETRYMIDDGQWSAWNRQRGLLLNNLLSGEHKIDIQAKNILGASDTTQTILSFKIPAPFYTQAEFLIPIGLLSASLIILGIAYATKKHKADTALRRSEHRYRSLFETANDAIMIIDPQKRSIMEVNSKACEIYGYTKAEFISMPLASILTGKNEKGNEYLWSMRDGESKMYETVYSTKSGNLLYMHINASMVDFEGKKVILTLHRDISDMRQAEAKIRLLAQTITSAQDYISITALDDTILFVNDAFARGHGYTEQELIGKDISIVRSPLTPKEKLDQLGATELSGNWNGEIFHRRKDGTDFHVEVWSAVVHGEENHPVAVVNVSRDVTERKKYEIDRENLILELQNALIEVKTLSGLLPICSNCKKIRDDKGYWIQVETYISKHSDATFTHGLCPECLKQYYPEVYERLKAKNQQP